MSHDANVDKMRLLTLVDLASKNKEVYYDVIMQSLMLENDEELVEQFILDGRLILLYLFYYAISNVF